MKQATKAAEQQQIDERWQRPARPLGWRSVGYYLGVPLAVALYAGLNNWEMQRSVGTVASIIFYLAHAMLPWWITCGCTSFFKKLLQAIKPPWIILLLLGHTLGCLLVLPYSNWLVGIYEANWSALDFSADSAAVFSAPFWIYWLRAGVIWVIINFVFDRFVGLPLYRYTIPRGYDSDATAVAQSNQESDGWNERPPGFIERLPAELAPAEVLAIKAEQHYIRVFSPTKEYMVLYRFSDAIRELDETLGKQVHRSYWINTNAIESVHAKAKDFSLRISSGADIPVSTPYQGLIRELARTRRIPSRG